MSGDPHGTEPEETELLRRERLARSEAEAAQARIQFLYQATSTLFSGPLSEPDKVSRLAQVSVPHVADWCIVDVLDSPTSMERVVMRHWDPSKNDAAQGQLGRFSFDAQSSAPSATAIRERAAQVSAPGAQDRLPAVGPLGAARSLVVVPLVASDRPLGVATFAFIDSHRSYDDADVRLLEDLCARAAMAIDHVRLFDQAKREIRAREDLLAVVSHDLRNPLGSILIAAKLLRKASSDEQVVKKNADRIDRSALQMERLIRDLLDLAAIEGGQLVIYPQPHRVSQLLNEALELMAPLASAKGLQLSAAADRADLAVLCDRERTMQVFSNLIGNAIKFTAAGSITLHAELTGQAVRLSVSDTGPGIAPEQLPHIFDRYWQANRQARHGVGLGLSIARGIVLAHQGRIWAESRPGQGTRFLFTLPVSDAPVGEPVDERLGERISEG